MEGGAVAFAVGIGWTGDKVMVRRSLLKVARSGVLAATSISASPVVSE